MLHRKKTSVKYYFYIGCGWCMIVENDLIVTRRDHSRYRLGDTHTPTLCLDPSCNPTQHSMDSTSGILPKQPHSNDPATLCHIRLRFISILRRIPWTLPGTPRSLEFHRNVTEWANRRSNVAVLEYSHDTATLCRMLRHSPCLYCLFANAIWRYQVIPSTISSECYPYCRT
jgi:hypothetical protein